MIEVKGLTKKYKTKNREVVALQGIDFVLKEGEIMGIVGASGAGKSTLLRMLNGLIQPTEGEVILDGVSLQSLKEGELRQIRQKIGMVFQSFQLLRSKTVLENVALPLQIRGSAKKERLSQALQMLSLVGLEDKKDDYPSQLSGGQQQRVAIARALMTNPRILLCDELTSALDPTTSREILTLLKDLNRRFSISIIIITHEMDLVQRICTRHLVLHQGRLVHQGIVDPLGLIDIEEYSGPPQEKKVLRIPLAGVEDQSTLLRTVSRTTSGRIKILQDHDTGRGLWLEVEANSRQEEDLLGLLGLKSMEVEVMACS